ncbi:MAG: precorrin-2 C(20)-methyltransferase [Candidatus Nitrosocaldus sp.]|nr:precorrin-2 C(20)-methyltransferase [Candidatus Nitrosocaldus sp.]MDW7999764.1 precorrin-2 C(20)-methyltransferase [Candidatus Nitrosocaldus sp.]
MSGTGTGSSGRLYCIGCGPGDPMLLTLKAVEVLKGCNVLFAPTSREGRESMALSIVRPVIDERIRSREVEVRSLIFPMVKDKSRLEDVWRSNADEIARECLSGKVVAYLCVGDPSLYSTFTYMHRELSMRYPEIYVEIVPGITSFTSFASQAKMNLVEGEQIMAIVPACYDLERVRSIARSCDTIVFLKDGRYFSDVIRIVRESMSDDAYVAIAQDVGSEGEIITMSRLRDMDVSAVSKYFSMMVVKREHQGYMQSSRVCRVEGGDG